MMRSIFLAAFAAIASAGGAAGAGAQTACPTPHTLHAAVASNLLSNASFKPARDSLGMAAVTPAGLRLLTDAQDQAACNQLRQMVASGGAIGTSTLPWAFYTAGGNYIIVSAAPPAPEGEARTGLSYVAVISPSFVLRKAFVL